MLSMKQAKNVVLHKLPEYLRQLINNSRYLCVNIKPCLSYKSEVNERK